jgi:RNA polymerase sigma-70 factor (ECF subfamily)
MTDIGHVDGAMPWAAVSSSVSEPRLSRGASRPASPSPPVVPASTPAGDDRVRALFDAHYDFVWRSLRGLGVAPGSVDDGAQQVFCLAFRKLDAIQRGSERSFLFRLASGVASNLRRGARRRRELGDDERLDGVAASSPDPEELASRGQARAILHDVLARMPEDLRVAFMLFELEEMEIPEIAAAIGIPIGTVGSRLRRAREKFQDELEHVRKTPAVRRGP